MVFLFSKCLQLSIIRELNSLWRMGNTSFVAKNVELLITESHEYSYCGIFLRRLILLSVYTDIESQALFVSQ